MECRISCEFLLRNFLLFAHATLCEQNTFGPWFDQGCFGFCSRVLSDFRFCLFSILFFVSPTTNQTHLLEWMNFISSVVFFSRVGWEGFALFLGGSFFCFPSLNFILPTHRHSLPLWSKRPHPSALELGRC